MMKGPGSFLASTVKVAVPPGCGDRSDTLTLTLTSPLLNFLLGQATPTFSVALLNRKLGASKGSVPMILASIRDSTGDEPQTPAVNTGNGTNRSALPPAGRSRMVCTSVTGALIPSFMTTLTFTMWNFGLSSPIGLFRTVIFQFWVGLGKLICSEAIDRSARGGESSAPWAWAILGASGATAVTTPSKTTSVVTRRKRMWDVNVIQIRECVGV